MARAIFAIPGDIDTLTGGYGYDRRVLALLPECGVEARHVRLPGAFPFPSQDDIAETIAALRAPPRDTILLVDGLAFSALPSEALSTIEQKIVALVHHPLGYEAGLSVAQSKALVALERAAPAGFSSASMMNESPILISACITFPLGPGIFTTSTAPNAFL